MKWNNPQSIPKDRPIVALIDSDPIFFKREPITILMVWDSDLNDWCQTLNGDSYFWHNESDHFRIKGWIDVPAVDAEIEDN